MKRLLALLLAAAFCTAQQSTNSGAGGGSGGFQIIGQGYPNAAITGVTTEQNVAAVKVPANSMGPNGELRVTLLLSMTNNANAKTAGIRLNATAGAISGGSIFQSSMPNVASAQLLGIVRNTGAANSQTGLQTITVPFGSGAAQTSIAIDTTQPTWINVGIWPAVSTDTITLLGYTVELHPG